MTSLPLHFLLIAIALHAAAGLTYKAAQIGGDGGAAMDDINRFPDFATNDYFWRMENILLWGEDNERLRRFQARYAFLDVNRPGTHEGEYYGPDTGTNARHFVIMAKKDYIERVRGWQRSDSGVFGGILLPYRLEFDVRRTPSNGLETYSAGANIGYGWNILGPIVGFYGAAGGAVDYVGVYIDPSLWPDRPSRLLMLRSTGRSISDGSEVAFDHNSDLSNPFTIRIASITVYYQAAKISALSVTYEDHVGKATTVNNGDFDGADSMATVTLEQGDYISYLSAVEHTGSICMEGFQIEVKRAGADPSTAGEVYSFGSLLNSVRRTEGPIVAFYGVYYPGLTCIMRLGGFMLVPSAELSQSCLAPTVPDHVKMRNAPERIGAGQVLLLECVDLQKVVTSGGRMTCGEDGTWYQEDTICSNVCPDLPPLVHGYYGGLESKYLLNGTSARPQCNYGFHLTQGGPRTCDDGLWTGNTDAPECALLCRRPITPLNGAFATSQTWYAPGDVLGYACEEGFMPVVGTPGLTCQSTGGWLPSQPRCYAVPPDEPVTPPTTQPTTENTQGTEATSTEPTSACAGAFKPITSSSSSEEVWATCGNVLLGFVILIAILLVVLLVIVVVIVVLTAVVCKRRRRRTKNSQLVSHVPFVDEEEEGGSVREDDDSEEDDKREEDVLKPEIDEQYVNSTSPAFGTVGSEYDVPRTDGKKVDLGSAD